VSKSFVLLSPKGAKKGLFTEGWCFTGLVCHASTVDRHTTYQTLALHCTSAAAPCPPSRPRRLRLSCSSHFSSMAVHRVERHDFPVLSGGESFTVDRTYEYVKELSVCFAPKPAPAALQKRARSTR